jgi:hypothetical protein
VAGELITQEGLLYKFTANGRTTVQDLFSIVPASEVTENTVLHSFAKVHTPQSRVIDILKTNLGEPLLLSSTDLHSSTQRDEEFETRNREIEVKLNEVMRIQWQLYDHVTCLIFGFVANKYTPADSIDPVSATLKFIRRLKDDPEFLLRTQEIFDWDTSSGSCSGSHYLFLNTLQTKSLPAGFDVLKSVKWTLRTGATHTILTGEGVDGTLYLIDIGVNYQTIRIRPSTSFAIEKSAIGSATGVGDEDYHMWKIRRTAVIGDWEI